MIVIDANDCRDTSAFTIAMGNSAPSPFSTNLDTAYYRNHPDIGLYPIADPVPDLSITYSFGGDGIWSDSLHPSAWLPERMMPFTITTTDPVSLQTLLHSIFCR